MSQKTLGRGTDGFVRSIVSRLRSSYFDFSEEKLPNFGDIFALVKDEKLAEARPLLEVLLEHDPREARHHALLGLICDLEGDSIGSEKAFREAIKWAPERRIFHVKLSEQQIKNEDLEGAQATLERAISLSGSPGDTSWQVAPLDGAEINFRRGQVLKNLGRPAEALECVNCKNSRAPCFGT